MKKINRSIPALSLLAATIAGITACGLKSESNRFGLDGVGDPRPPDGNIISGKYSGTFETSRWVTSDARIQGLIGADFSLVQGLFSHSGVEGLAGLPLLVISTTPPPRATGIENCYEDLGVFPELGGALQFVDVGSFLNYDAGPGALQSVTRAADNTFSNPQSDQITYVSNFNLQKTFAYDQPNTMTWSGGTLDSKGFFVAPARTATDTVLNFPAELVAAGGAGPNPTVNGVDMLTPGTDIATAATYKIQWQPVTGNTQDLGVEIIVQIYGPVNLPATATPNVTKVQDLPYFNKLGQLVCLAKESDGTAGFKIPQAMLDKLDADLQLTTAYAKSTEDVNGNGVIDPGEDGNKNHKIDKTYGAVLIVNRRTENVFQACLDGNGTNCVTKPVFISGNASKMNHLKWLKP